MPAVVASVAFVAAETVVACIEGVGSPVVYLIVVVAFVVDAVVVVVPQSPQGVNCSWCLL